MHIVAIIIEFFYNNKSFSIIYLHQCFATFLMMKGMLASLFPVACVISRDRGLLAYSWPLTGAWLRDWRLASSSVDHTEEMTRFWIWWTLNLVAGKCNPIGVVWKFQEGFDNSLRCRLRNLTVFQNQDVRPKKVSAFFQNGALIKQN